MLFKMLRLVLKITDLRLAIQLSKANKPMSRRGISLTECSSLE